MYFIPNLAVKMNANINIEDLTVDSSSETSG